MRNLLKKPCACLPQRYIMCLMAVTGLMLFFLLRVSTILAITEMTFRHDTGNSSKITGDHYCPQRQFDKKIVKKSKAEFHWSQGVQHNIIKAFYLGYIVAQLPSGIISDMMGGKAVFGYGMLVSALTTLLIPTLARLSPYAFMVGRVIQGFGQGAMVPTTSSLLAKWAPPNEKSRMNGIILSGVNLGNGLGFIFSGYILHTFPGWATIFYISGSMAVLWCFGWYILVFSSPEKHPFITDKEREMILRLQKIKKKPKNIPWVSILTSVPVISALLTNFAHSWAILTLINEMPAYSDKVLNYNIIQSGFFSAAPHMSMAVTAISGGYLVDWLIIKGYMSLTNSRKIFSVLANCLPVPFMIGASYAGCNRNLAVVLFMMMTLFVGLSYSTIKTLPVDMAPNYAGIISALMVATGASSGFISPFFTSTFITGDGSIEEWRKIFFLSGFIMIIFSIPFLFVGNAEVQPWNHVAVFDEEQKPEAVENVSYQKPQT